MGSGEFTGGSGVGQLRPAGPFGSYGDYTYLTFIFSTNNTTLCLQYALTHFVFHVEFT